MNLVVASVAILLAVNGASPVEAKRCPVVTQMLVGARSFSTLVGMAGCVTSSAQAFLVLYRARDVDGFRALAKASAPGAQLYGLCGLKHLRVDAEASDLRKKLEASQQESAVVFGEGASAKTPVNKLVTAQDGQPVSEFDATCDYLVQHGTGPTRHTCDSASARLTCR